MTKNLSEQATQFEDLTRRFLSAWQSWTPSHLGGLGMTEFRAMVALEAQGEATMTEIARALGLTLGATTSVVDRLVTAENALREHDSKDRRVVRVKLTPKGQQKLAQVIRGMTDDVARLLNEIPVEDRSKFLDTYRKVVDVAEKNVDA